MAAISTKPRRVICLNSGQLFDSINAAARVIGAEPSSVLRAIRAGRALRGMWFVYTPDQLEGDALERWRVARLLGCIGYEVNVNGGNGNV